jgi:hypothetical protein
VYTVADSSGAASQARVVVTVGGAGPPVAEDDVYAVGTNAVFEVPAPGVLGNDRDPGGGALVATLLHDARWARSTSRPTGGFTYSRPPASAA